MELFSYKASDLDGCEEVARLGTNAVFAGFGFHYLLKENGTVWQLNDAEISDLQKFLEKVEEYNL